MRNVDVRTSGRREFDDHQDNNGDDEPDQDYVNASEISGRTEGNNQNDDDRIYADNIVRPQHHWQ